jgi:DNA-binding XRE family transcriptional regulator
MSEHDKRQNAEMDMLGNDIFWSFHTPYPDCEKLIFTGYNDDNWWRNVSNTATVRRQTDKCGREWEIDFRTCIVVLVSEKESLGAQLKARRKTLNLTQFEIAQKLDCEYKTIWRIESDNQVRKGLISRYAELLGVKIVSNIQENDRATNDPSAN